jgi:hypothetical protein
VSTSDGSVVGTTQIVDHGPSSKRFDLVILGDGYRTTELGQFATDAQSFVTKLFATAPFDDNAVAATINVHRVDVTSTDSGADDPKACGGTGATARTYFDAKFCSDGKAQRLLEVNDRTALAVAGAQVPNWNMVIVIVNTTTYGGSGGAVAAFSLGRDANGLGADETDLHEMGHTAFGLADDRASFEHPARINSTQMGLVGQETPTSSSSCQLILARGGKVRRRPRVRRGPWRDHGEPAQRRIRHRSLRADRPAAASRSPGTDPGRPRTAPPPMHPGPDRGWRHPGRHWLRRWRH